MNPRARAVSHWGLCNSWRGLVPVVGTGMLAVGIWWGRGSSGVLQQA